MDTKEMLRSFELFNEKADKLERSSFTTKVFDTSCGITFDFQVGAEATVERRGPGEESIDAFILTLRFFIQDNERISFRNMNAIYAELKSPATIEPLIIEHFESYRDQVNGFLDSPFEMLNISGRNLSRREIFDTFIYGNLAHTNQQKKEVFDIWRRSAFLFPIFESEFVVILGTFLNAIFCISDLNKRAIKQLQN